MTTRLILNLDGVNTEDVFIKIGDKHFYISEERELVEVFFISGPTFKDKIINVNEIDGVIQNVE